MKLRSMLYRAARILGDVQAMQRGPDAVVKRTGRKIVYRVANRVARSLFR